MIVLDCSAAISMARLDENGRALRWLCEEGEKVVAPDLVYAEMSHALSKYARGGYLGVPDAAKLGSLALSLVDEVVSSADLWAEAMCEAARLRHPAYDMLYFVLTRRRAATLFTLDRKLQSLCLENGVNCVHLAELPEVG